MIRVKVFPPRGCERSALDERGWLEMPEGSTVADVLKIIRCSRARAKLLMVSLNGVKTNLNAELRDGDVLGFFALIAGG